MAALAAERRGPDARSPMLPSQRRLAEEAAAADPGTARGLDTIAAMEAADVFGETPPRVPAYDIRQRQNRYTVQTRGARPSGVPDTPAQESVRLVADRSVAPPKPSWLQRAYTGCVGALCPGRTKKKEEGGRRRRHHKGKKTLKRTRRSTRRHRRHR
jgi:hypothetical protein